MTPLFFKSLKYAVVALALGAGTVQPIAAEAMPMAQPSAPAAPAVPDVIQARASWAGGNNHIWRHGGHWGGRWNGGGHWNRGWRGGHWRGGYYRHRDYWGPALGLGLGLGMLGAYDYYDAPRYRVYRGGNAHVRWCYARYRSYRAYDNSFQPYHGPRQQCYSPY